MYKTLRPELVTTAMMFDPLGDGGCQWVMGHRGYSMGWGHTSEMGMGTWEMGLGLGSEIKDE